MIGENRVLILINNTAGTGRALDDIFDIISGYASKGYEPVVYPIIPGTELTSENIIDKYRGQVDTIMCIGGDGTLNHVMSSIVSMEADKRPVLAYIPSGSTNDFAKCLGIPDTREAAIDTAINGRLYSYDVGRLNGRYFNYVAAFGAFSEISYDTDQTLKNVMGYAAYVINAITKLPQNINYSCPMRIEYDGEAEEGEYVFGAVCNSVTVGGMKLFGRGGVKLNDGLMELLLIRAPKSFGELNSILTSLATGVDDNPYISSRLVSHVTFRSDNEVTWSVDGEYGGESRESEIEVLRKAVTIRRSGRKG